MTDGEWKVMEGWKPHNTMTPSVLMVAAFLLAIV